MNALKSAVAAGALVLALAVAGCSAEADLNQVAAANANATLEQIPAPNGGSWTEVAAETPEGGYRLGNPEAPVKLVEYASISCPHCAQFAVEASEPLRERYVRSGQVSFEYRPVLLFPTDPGIFLLLRCQGAQPFFRLTDQLYATQAQWSARTRAIPPAQLQALEAMPPREQAGALARALGMDAFFRQRGMPQARVDQCLSDQAGFNRLAEIHARGGREDNVTATPTFFINGERQEGVGYWRDPQVASRSLETRLRAAIGA